MYIELLNTTSYSKNNTYSALACSEAITTMNFIFFNCPNYWKVFISSMKQGKEQKRKKNGHVYFSQ